MSPGRPALALALALAALTRAGAARADAIEGPPGDCPPGSVGEASHAGSWCEPADCAPQTDCDARMRTWATSEPVTPGRFVCRPGVGVCVRTTRISAGGRMAGSELITKREALSACTTNADCPTDAPCEVASRCMEAATYHSPASPLGATFWHRAFSCDDDPAAPTRVGGIFFGLGGLGLALVLTRRRR